jgi:FtsH-binding integral membrane protein
VLSAAIKLPSSLDTQSLKSALVVAAVVLVALGLLSAWLMKTIITKAISMALLLALAGFVWVQRSNLTDCANQVTNVAPGATEVRCTVAGFSVKIPTSQLPVDIRQQVEAGH